MNLIIYQIQQYCRETDKRLMVLVSVFTGLLIFLNYNYAVDDTISGQDSFAYSLVARYFIFLTSFSVPYLLYRVVAKRNYIRQRRFQFLLFAAPALFSLKVALNIPLHFLNNPLWNNYWNHIFYWPLLLIITGIFLFTYWNFLDRQQPFYGLHTSNINWKPYFLMLLIMVPLVTAASTQADFLAVYPKIKVITGMYQEEAISWWYKLLFELSYGSDFITIELFFRGFLVLAFVKWAGKDAILPMACFYCTIHFGKPIGECISSYFGGILLGIVVYYTRSILGGLIVHLGIAWMMEIGGYLGN